MNQPQQKISAPLGDLRERIDDIDGKLSGLIDERMAVADEVGARKRRLGLAVHALKREEALLSRITSGRDPETSHVLHSVYEVLIAGSRRRQLAPILSPEDIPEKGSYEARLPVLPGESSRSVTAKALAALLAGGFVPEAVIPGGDAVSITFRSEGDQASQILIADLIGLGATVRRSEIRHKALRPGAGLLCGLLGRTLSHTLSPAIHKELAAYAYKCFEVEPDRLDKFFASVPFDGLNVTIPYKEAVIPFLARLTDRAEKVGAVNTIIREADGSLTGDNTDYAGFEAMIAASGIDVKGKKALILGTGGAAKCVFSVLRDMGANPKMVSRTGELNYENIARESDAAILVNATPVGMYPRAGAAPVENLAILPHLEFVFDLIYNPARTKLMLEAEARGVPSMNGLLMLVVQAIEASRRFLWNREPAANTSGLFRKLALENENIVLSGMPGSGKSTVGRAIASALGREFIDLDDAIVAAADCSIPEIFARDGEKAFRDLETHITQLAGARRGVVIATGGGTLLREKNREALKQNGRIALLTRPLSDLPVAGRPVSLSKPLTQIWEERKDIYLGNADVTIENTGAPEDAAAAILRAFGQAR